MNMASAAKIELAFDPVDDIGFIDVGAIDMGERLREVDEVWADALGHAMLREGQATPIVVCRLPGRNTWTLVAGAHRVVGAKKVGLERLKAELIGPDKLERRQREISENLWRKDLDPIDRANFIAELVRITKLRAGIEPDAAGRSASANARWQKEVKNQADDANLTMRVAYGWTEEVAAQIGLSKATIERDMMIHVRIAPSSMEKLRAFRPDIAKNATQLRALAKFDPEQQAKIINTLQHGNMQLGGRQPKSVAEAAACLANKAGRTKEADEKRLSAFIGNFSRMGLAEKKGALEHLGPILPAGFRLIGPDDDFKPTTGHMADIAKGLEAAFKVLIALDPVDGEGADDEAITEAQAAVQFALITANSLKKGGRA